MRRLSRAVFFIEHRTWFVCVFEIALILGSFWLSWIMVEGLAAPTPIILVLAAPLLVAARLGFMARFRLFHGWWRYTGINEAFDICKAVVCGSAVFAVAGYLIGIRFAIAWYFIEALLTLFLLCGVRLISRLVAESVREDSGGRVQVGIIGAGFAAQQIIRELRLPDSNYVPVACFDDNTGKIGIALHGVPVAGTVDQLPENCGRFEIEEILIAVPSATGAQMRRFVQICEATGLPFKTVPSLRDLLSGNVRLSQIRQVAVEDLLGREPVRIDLDTVRRYVTGKVIMVTGAAGSIGSELARQLCEYRPARLICVDQNETGIFYLQRELTAKGAQSATYVVGNIGDSDRMRKLCCTYGVNVIFHAAAYKHVPVMEANVQEAVNNNVFSLLRLLTVAEQSGCDTFLMISSDKAVNPTSIMGCTKRIGELILSSWPSNGMRCVSVRFGNVLGSSGSVVPIFQELLRQNRPLTITHPDIERFFMTIPEAVGLVLQASAIGQHGDILVLDMGEPVRILDLAHTLIRLSGKRPEDVMIHFTGLRQGEKLYEELFYDSEQVLDTSCAKIKRTSIQMVEWPELRRYLDELKASLYVDGPDPVRKILKEMVPECRFGGVSTPHPVMVKSEAAVSRPAAD